jgi:signal transduction histidine kinase
VAPYHSDTLDESRLRQLIDVGRDLVAELDPEVVLGRVLDVAQELTGARYAALGILDGERRHLERFLTKGIDEEGRREIGDLPRGHGVLGLLIHDPRPLRLSRVGDHPQSYGFPSGHPPMDSFLGVPVRIRGRSWGNLYLTEKAGGEFDEGDVQAVSILAEWTAIAIENASLYQSAERQRDAMEHTLRRLEATTEIARAVGGETDLNRILETIVKRARALVEARGMLILLSEGEELAVVACAGELGGDLLDVRIPLARSISGHVMTTKRAERLSNVSSQLRFALGNSIDVRSGLFVPLLYRGRALGVLNGFDRDGGEDFSPEDQRLLEGFAASAATAVATAQSVAEERLRGSIAAAERERGRWARELHDEALQSLAGLRVLLSAARRKPAEERDRLLAQGLSQIDTAIMEMRQLIADLRPAALDDLGLGPSLEALGERLRAQSGDMDLSVRIDLAHPRGDHPTRLVPEIEDTIYRLVQEALNNAIQHGSPRRISLTAVERGEIVSVEVADDGAGFEPGGAGSGFGLLGMRERVQLAGGSLEVRTALGEGTTIVAALPARHRDEEAGRRGRLSAAEGG